MGEREGEGGEIEQEEIDTVKAILFKGINGKVTKEREKGGGGGERKRKRKKNY